ncbi:MAG: aminopeptidase P family protein, partial [Mesorhizobium sp.]
MPFEPAEAGSIDALRLKSRQKAAELNQHVLGYGALVEAEWQAAGIAAPDLPTMRRYRLDRIRAELKRRNCAGAVLYDPINIRYATDSTNMQLWVAHNPT